jgi:hypothetical protein
VSPTESEEAHRLEKSKNIGIVLFVMVVVLSGIAVIALGILQYHGTYYEMILSSIGATLIAVGIVDVFSELFVRPSLVSIMRRSFPLFSDTTKVPKETLRKLIIEIVGLLSPRPDLKEEFKQFFESNIVRQFHQFFREDFKVSIELRTKQLGESKIVEVFSEWTYDVHNITDEVRGYPIPFRCSTYSFVSRGLALRDHIQIEKMQVTRTSKPSEPEDIGKNYGAYSQIPKKIDSAKVELKFDKAPVVEIEPLQKVTIFIKYRYVAEHCDDHTQRMSVFTKNIHLILNFDPNELFVDVDEFCIPKKTTVAKAHSYVWNGWFLPNHGFIVEWKPKAMT